VEISILFTTASIKSLSISVFSLVVFGSLLAPLAYAQDFLPLTTLGRYGVDEGHFKSPTDITVSPQRSGNVYVADTGNNRIQMFSGNGSFITKWGAYGISNGNFKSPSSVAVDSAGNVYVADTGNNRIQMFSGNGSFITKWGAYGISNGNFNQPQGIAIIPQSDNKSNNILVSDTENNRIQMFSGNGTFITKWGRYGINNGHFKSPTDITVSTVSPQGSGSILVSDTENNRIQMFSGNGTFITKWGRYGTANGTLNLPQGIAVVPQSGNILVTDVGNNRVLVFNLEYLTNISFSNVDENITVNDTNLRVRLVAEDLEFPTSIAFLGPDDIVVLERMKGTVKRIVDGKMLEEPLLNLSDYKIRSCMCGIAVAKQNLTTYVFLLVDELEDNNNKLFDRLYRYELVNNSKLANPRILLDIPIKDLRAEHHGGKIMVGPDNNLYVTTGDIYGYNTKAQNIQNGSEPDGSGAILRITLDGKAVEGSGILGDSDPLNKYYAYGIRNSFGIDRDPLSGKVWITDNGPEYGDEINLVEPGFNGGWKKVMGMASLKRGFDPASLVNFDNKGVYSDPQFEWLNPIGPTAIKFLNSTRLGHEYHNDMFVGDVNTGNLYRFQLNDNRTELSLNGSTLDKVANNIKERDQAIFARGFGGISDIQVGPDGFLYILSIIGKIYAITPSSI
jgi:aldose sugar dehydrogenase